MIMTATEEKMISVGYEALSIFEKNSLIVYLGSKDHKLYQEIDTEYILNHHKYLKVGIVNEACEDTIVNGFVASNGNSYRLDRDDQINMMGQKIELLEGPEVTSIPWKTQNQGYVVHTREEWLLIYKEAFAHKRQNLIKYNTLKEQIIVATTHEAIVALNW